MIPRCHTLLVNDRRLMKITRINVYRFVYSLRLGDFAMSGGKGASGQDGTIVRIETDAGLIGWGEVCPFSPKYMAAFGEGARAAIHEFAPDLIGLDPRQIDVIETAMDRSLPGHHYAKAPIDLACWDILGQAAGMSLCELLGGRFSDTFPVYTGIGIDEPSRMRDRAEEVVSLGFRRVQIKVGDGWRADIERIDACLEVLSDMDVVTVDSNAGWNVHEAMRVLAEYRGADFLIEQPCSTIEACGRVRDHVGLPLVLDESLVDYGSLTVANEIGALDGANLKLARFGGITRTKRMRDLCTQWGIAMTIEDSGGGDIVSAAMTHMTASTRPGLMLNGYLAGDMVNEHVADGAPRVTGGLVEVPRGPGLGINVDESLLGPPVFQVS